MAMVLCVECLCPKINFVKHFDKIPLRPDAMQENEELQSPTTFPIIARQITTHQVTLVDLVHL